MGTGRAFEQTPSLLLAVALLVGSGAAASDRLTAGGIQLEPRSYSTDTPFEVSVDVAGEAVTASHVILRPASSNLALARDRDGFWAPWDGDRAALPQAGATLAAGRLRFKLFAAPPPDLTPPFTITIAYRTADGMRYGWFDAVPETQP